MELLLVSDSVKLSLWKDVSTPLSQMLSLSRSSSGGRKHRIYQEHSEGQGRYFVLVTSIPLSSKLGSERLMDHDADDCPLASTSHRTLPLLPAHHHCC